MRRIFSSLGSLLGVVALIVLVMALAFIFRSRGGETVAWQPPSVSTPVPSIENVRMSDTPGGPAVINFPSRTSSVYLIFEYAQVQDTPVAVRTYDRVGNVLFEQTQNYSGEGVETIGVVSRADVFADGRYVTNVYVGSELFVVKTLMWAVGEPPTPMPTMTSTPMPTPAPPTPPPSELTPAPPAPTLTPIPTPSGPLPSGPKIVYAETFPPIINPATPSPFGDHNTTASTLWIANVSDLTKRRNLVTFIHKAGYGVNAAVSPDGNRISYIVLPPGPGERARLFNATLWVLDIDSSAPRKLAEGLDYYVNIWSPDSRTVVCQKNVPIPNPPDENIPLRTEFYAVDIDSGEQGLLLADDTAYGISPVGWSPEGTLFYYRRITLAGEHELWTVDVASGTSQFKMLIHNDIVSGIAISPDGEYLLASLLESREPTISYALVILSIDGTERKAILSGTTGDKPVNRHSAIWCSSGTQLAMRVPPEANQPAKLQIMDLRTGERQTIATAEAPTAEEFLIPRSCSPDGKWLVVEKYPTMHLDVFLMTSDGNGQQKLPAEPGNWVVFAGWSSH
ncbi:MAG: TolB family protein [Anaerolineae bacterium]